MAERSMPFLLKNAMRAALSTIPAIPPITVRKIVSSMIILKTLDLLMPTAISMPSSLVRSNTIISMVLTMPKARANKMMPRMI